MITLLLYLSRSFLLRNLTQPVLEQHIFPLPTDWPLFPLDCLFKSCMHDKCKRLNVTMTRVMATGSLIVLSGSSQGSCPFRKQSTCNIHQNPVWCTEAAGPLTRLPSSPAAGGLRRAEKSKQSGTLWHDRVSSDSVFNPLRSGLRCFKLC